MNAAQIAAVTLGSLGMTAGAAMFGALIGSAVGEFFAARRTRQLPDASREMGSMGEPRS